jgi:GT2 family glycosyltransferase
VTNAVVIIVNYDSGERLYRCLLSVLAQQPPPRRVLVVDNASTDGSAENLPQGVELVQRPKNGGFAAALLDGLAASQEPFVWTLNPDLEVQPGCFAAAEAALEADERAGSVAPRVLQQDAPDRIDATAIGITSCLGQLNLGHGLHPDQVAADSQLVLGPLGGAALWRRSALEKAGNFDPRYFLYWEDMDVALRLHRVGYVCRTVPEACILHEGGGTVGHHSPRNVFYMVRNHWICLLRSLPGPILRERAGALLVAPIRAALLYAGRGRGLSALAGLICGTALIPASLWSRRHLPRGASDDEAAAQIRALMSEADGNRAAMRKASPAAREVDR